MMRTATILSFILLLLPVTGCEVFVVGNAKRQAVIERSQRTSAGVVHLFKAELDSNNTAAATELMMHSSGRRMLAVEKYDLSDELQRWRKQMQLKPITNTVTDTVSESQHTVHITMDYIKNYTFSTVRVEDAWYVTSIKNAQRPQ